MKQLLFNTQVLKYSYFEKVVRRNAHALNVKGNRGYDQYAVPDTVAVKSSIVAFL